MTSIEGQQDGAIVGNDSGGLQAALARTLTRSIGLYFSRPVRLFRPAKISGWHALQHLAQRDGSSFSANYVLSLIKAQGLGVIPKHFIPPIAVNAFLGTVLWTSYAEAYSLLEPRMGQHSIFAPAASGMVAGATQALLAAPAENVRLVLEGGSGYRTWSHAWQEVFRFTPASSASLSKEKKMEEIRRLRAWMHEVGEMAGHGWQGWGWGCAKDMCGFAAFFTIFEVTRRIAAHTKTASVELAELGVKRRVFKAPFGEFLPRIVHALTLVSGGVAAGLAYEYVCLPWDNARRIVYLERSIIPNEKPQPSLFSTLSQKLREEGISPFFQHRMVPHESPSEFSVRYPKTYVSLRTLARAGPWGIGFLVWEAYGPGL
ncbi:hypothetical protein BDN72DRAFT_852853 [Pluteus cervinus]|uniref:Uncharacterized protein n=1 Tax=Pluteus cervinus TaxID=181527 RepID=A0ACD3BEQ5_9AGAR|nr:hypothetical protein BDN72DRAFT_852853 [Pluteus cervinus]